jgi:colanic acid/amylovoran biosynthesis glycosyltransferase
MEAKIGYFIPQLLGKTHIFLLRERQVIAELGIETDLVST